MMNWDIDQIAELCLAIQQVPAPTGAEYERAQFIAERFEKMGLNGIEVDDTPNVYARVAGVEQGPGLMVSAHLDTVFPAETDLTNRREEMRLYGPGIGDNSMGLTGLLTLAGKAAGGDKPPDCDLWFVANAGEEGLGDLKGMRRAVDRLGSQIKGCIVLEGAGAGIGPRKITHRGLGVRRYRIDVKARGGHSWDSFGEPSAVHVLVRMANEITEWQVPESPRTTFNIGLIEGGTSVNTIAEHACLLLDLRSEDAEELNRLVVRTEKLAASAGYAGDAEIKATVVGDRPTGSIGIDHPLVAAATQILKDLGVPKKDVQYRIGSTDANIPLSRGIPAVTIYLTDGHDIHRASEWLSLESLPMGMTLASRLIDRAAKMNNENPRR
jgi:acetylornithine deacetylase/succinyl-diaminopimelate desuccinylase-like protein